jgi:hypothetical protein
MFSMSLKSVPGCLVLIAPSGIGVPVAATPGFEPQDDVAEDALVLVAAAVLVVAELAAGVLVVVLLELLPQPARTVMPTVAKSARLRRIRGRWWLVLTGSLLLGSGSAPALRGSCRY